MSDVARPLSSRAVGLSWSRPYVRALVRALTLERMALIGILLLSALLQVVALDQEGYGNTYYAAAVKSMLSGWHNFFFLSLDPSGFLAVDKPPLGLWIQAAGARIFGFSGLSLLLPQAVAAVASIALLYYLLARIFGSGVALLAALALAVTPIAVVDGRNNSPDTLLTLVLLLSAWAVTKATDTGRTRWLFLSAIFVGLGFNIKELEAFLVVPAIAVAYWVGTRTRWWSRLWRLIISGLVTLVVSLAWIVAVDLTPTGQRPYVTDSGTNSELSLALGYNGMGRFLSSIVSRLPTVPFLHVKIDLAIVPGISTKIYSPGPFRLFRPVIAEQVGWLLAIAVIGLGFALWRFRVPTLRQEERVGYALWAVWLLSAGAFFSTARFYHLYYLVILAPAVAALAGVALVGMWNAYRDSAVQAKARRYRGWLLPFGLLATALAQAFVLFSLFAAGGWPVWIWPLVVAIALVAASGLVAIHSGAAIHLGARRAIRPRSRLRAAALLAIVGTVALLAAPTAWSVVSVAQGNGGDWIPQAGSAQFIASSAAEANTLSEGPGGGAGGALTYAGSQVPKLDPKLLHYLEARQGEARYLVATTTSTFSTLFILQTNASVMTLGGYQGWDRIVTPVQLSRLVSHGVIRFFLLPVFYGVKGKLVTGAFTSGPGIEDYRYPPEDVRLSRANRDLAAWITQTCAAVAPPEYESVPAGHEPLLSGVIGKWAEPGQLWDCRDGSRHKVTGRGKPR
jgi:4-amino-4-deoxy-L-arabinose transferase-like glycosyltransferase